MTESSPSAAHGPDGMPADEFAEAPGPQDVAAAKEAVRHRVRAARRALDPAERERQSAAATERLWSWLGPRVADEAAAGRTPVVGTVLSMATEPDTGVLRARLHAAGARVLVPVIEPARRLSWTPWTPGVETARSAHAPVDEPVGPRFGVEALAGATALVLPGLAATRDGARMGQGGGYYDRVLAALDPAVPTVAVLFEDELLEPGALPLEPTDRRVDAVATAAGLHVCGAGLPGSR